MTYQLLDTTSRHALFDCTRCEQTFIGIPITTPKYHLRYCHRCWDIVQTMWGRKRA